MHAARNAFEDTGRIRRHEPILYLLGHCESYIPSRLISAHLLCRDIDKRSYLCAEGFRRESSLNRQCSRSTNAESLDVLHHPHPHSIHRNSIDAHPAHLAHTLLYQNHSRWRYTSIHVYIPIPLVQGSMGNNLSRNHRLRSHCHWIHGHLAHHQWIRSLFLSPLGICVQVPLYLGVGSTEINGYWRPILSESHQSRFRRTICSRDLSLCIVLPG